MKSATVLLRLFAGPNGRIRLGWRLILFLILTLSIAIPITFVLPTDLGAPVGSLLGAILAGWWLLTRDQRGFASLGFYFSSDAIRESVRGVALGIGIGAIVITAIYLLGGVR